MDANELKALRRKSEHQHGLAERLRDRRSSKVAARVGADEESKRRVLAAIRIQNAARRRRAVNEVSRLKAEIEAREEYERENMAAVAAQEAKERAIEKLRLAERKRKHVEKVLPGPFSCLLCCCCSCTGGIADMLLSDTTREFALAVILGEGFMDLTGGVAETLLTPLIGAIGTALANPDLITLDVQGDFVIIVAASEEARDAGETYSSAVAAEDAGAIVLKLGALITFVITFMVTIYGTYLIFKACPLPFEPCPKLDAGTSSLKCCPRRDAPLFAGAREAQGLHRDDDRRR
jgi:large-conductance mechanosensitive channel